MGEAVTVRMPGAWLWLIRGGGAALGCGAGFAVAPLVNRLQDLVGGAPGPLRLAALLPTVWAVPVLTVVGSVVGVWVASIAHRQSPAVTVADDHVAVLEGGSGLHLSRDRVAGVFTDGRDLVVLDHREGELTRVPVSDLPTERLHAAFERFDYPWRGTVDPREAEFLRWLDGTPDLDEPAHALLRARKRALADKQAGTAEDVLDRLRAMGVTVRDRDGVQQYRRTSSGQQQTSW